MAVDICFQERSNLPGAPTRHDRAVGGERDDVVVNLQASFVYPGLDFVEAVAAAFANGEQHC